MSVLPDIPSLNGAAPRRGAVLSRQPRRGGAEITLAPDVALTPARLHEGCGAARHGFATWLASKTQGPVFWIAPSWSRAALNPDGVAQLAQPGRFTFITPERAIDILWCLEECLRTGLVPLVVADLPEPPGLTPVRRLHLAAETGAQVEAQTGGQAPLGLILTPGEGGAPGVESRWRMQPAHDARREGWHLTRLRARTAPVRDWTVRRENGKMHARPARAQDTTL